MNMFKTILPKRCREEDLIPAPKIEIKVPRLKRRKKRTVRLNEDTTESGVRECRPKTAPKTFSIFSVKKNSRENQEDQSVNYFKEPEPSPSEPATPEIDICYIDEIPSLPEIESPSEESEKSNHLIHFQSIHMYFDLYVKREKCEFKALDKIIKSKNISQHSIPDEFKLTCNQLLEKLENNLDEMKSIIESVLKPFITDPSYDD